MDKNGIGCLIILALLLIGSAWVLLLPEEEEEEEDEEETEEGEETIEGLNEGEVAIGLLNATAAEDNSTAVLSVDSMFADAQTNSLNACS